VTDTADTPPPAKADPETLVLRAAPMRVTRFRRGAIILLAGAAATGIAGAAWLALKPVNLGIVAGDEERGPVAAKAPTDALAGAPSSYGDVPQLGPPLPGDLGGPILDRQREMAMAPVDPEADEAAKAAEAERQRVAAEQRAARESGVMLQIAGRATAAPSAGMVPDAPPEPLAIGAATSRADLSDQERKNALVGQSNDRGDINPHPLTAPVSPWTLHAGSVIAASLITGLNSDLPGLVTAQITENVYDSVTGRTLLIPQGSRLIGSYDSVVAFGQSRALVVWQRIILPDGSSIRIDNVSASDTEGYAGLADRIDRHTWKLLKGVTLSTLLGVGTELGWGSSESDLVRAVRESAQQSGARAGDQIVTRNLDVQPTLSVRPGWPLRIVVHKDIVVARPWNGTGS
jgi:type IV secretion system protein VirB10